MNAKDKTMLKEQLIRLLKSDGNAICRACEDRAGTTGLRDGERFTDSVRLLLRDLARVIEGKLPAGRPDAPDGEFLALFDVLHQAIDKLSRYYSMRRRCVCGANHENNDS